MTKEELTIMLKSAIRRLYVENKFLLQIIGSERAVAHQLAKYLYCDLHNSIGIVSSANCACCGDLSNYEQNNLVIDCEYNRQTTLPKRVNPQDHRSNLIIPDIALHKRGCDCRNFFAIEIKLLSALNCFNDDNEYNMKKDFDSLYTLKTNYRYKYTIFIGLPKSVNVELIEFIAFNDITSVINKKFSAHNRNLFNAIKSKVEDISNIEKVVLLLDTVVEPEAPLVDRQA